MASRFLIKLEYNSEKFCNFFVNLFERKAYNFVDLTNDIKANVRSLQYVTPTTIRIRFRDDDGDYINLTYGDHEMFNEMFEAAKPVKDRDYKKLYLKVSQLDSPVQIPLKKNTVDDVVLPEVRNVSADQISNKYGQGGDSEHSSRLQIPDAQKGRISCSLSSRFGDGTDPLAADLLAADPFAIDPFAEPSDDSDNDEEPPFMQRALSQATKATTSPLERYVIKLKESRDEQKRKVTTLKDKLRTVDDKLSQAKSSHFGEGNVCGNCHLRLGHTAKKCALETCTKIFDCGLEKYHPGQINRTKMRHEIQKEENRLQKLNTELNSRQSATESLKKSLVSQVEHKLLSENKSDYVVGGMKNWTLLRRHVHLIEGYCKRNFNGKIPPKQNLARILQMAMAEEEQDNILSQPKRRRTHENPAKHVLESYGVNFPSSSTLSCSSSPSTSISFLNPSSSDLVSRCEPKSKAEEEAQLDFVLKASACSGDSLTGSGNQKYCDKTERVFVDLTTKGDLPEAANDENTTSVTKQESNENNAAMVLLSLFNSNESKK